MSKSKVFIGIAISFAAGVWLASRFFVGLQYALVALAVAFSVLGFCYFFRWRTAALAALFLSCACLGVLRLDWAQKPNGYSQLFESKQKLEGYIVEDIDIRTDKQLITFRPKGYGQKILITTTKGGEYFYGDWVVAEGKIAEPKSFEDFDYPMYLERYGIYGLMKYPKILVLKNHRGSWVKEQLLRVKYAYSARIGKILAEPKSSLLAGILIGARKTLPQDILDNFAATGLSHVVAVSGYNISIIVSSLAGLLAGLFGRKWSFWLCLLVMSGFVVIAGASASVVRAALMGFLVLLSTNIGRQYSITPSLFFAAFLMLVINPKILFWDAGFQLSFLATMGIVYVVPLLDKLTASWPDHLNIKGTFFTTMSAIIATLPLILYNFGRLSLVAPVANILVLPVIPTVMLFGFLTFLPFVGPGFGLITGWLLAYILKIISTFARLPFASLEIKINQLVFIALSLVVALLYLILVKISKRPAKVIE